MPKWMKLAAGWALAVTIALAFSWGAVARVRSSVIEPSVEIPTAAASASSAAPTSQTSTSAPSVIGLDPEVVDSSTSTTGVTTGTTPATTQTTASQSSPSTTTPTTTSSTATAPAPTKTSSHTLVGGVVTISYSPGVVTFVSAIPQPGYSTDRKATGPVEVRIRFDSESHTSDFRAEWEGGELRISQDESGGG